MSPVHDDPHPTMADTLARDAFLGEMYSHRFLPDGWNGPKSKAPSLSAIVNLMNLVRELPKELPIPATTAHEDGSLGMFWDLKGLYVEMNTDRQGEALSVYVHRPNESDWRTSVPLVKGAATQLQFPLNVLIQVSQAKAPKESHE